MTELGLIALALNPNALGHEIEGPMAIVILVGLISSTFLTVLVLPTLARRFARFENERKAISVATPAITENSSDPREIGEKSREARPETRIERVAVCLFFIFGLIAIGISPLTDPSESRYATIAQRMVLSGKWLVPEILSNNGFIPFWGKPPLHFWAVAASMKLFGFTEFAARLPSLLCLSGSLWLVVTFARRCLSDTAARLLPFLAVTSPVFMVLGLSCLTDVSLLFWTTLALVSFAMHVEARGNGHWGDLLFFALGAGFLVKGPLILLLVGLVTVGWLLLTKRWEVIRYFSWLRGILLMVLFSVPWFIFAERATPGLLRYFFVNENFLRFFSTKYGDRYGSPHPTFRGVILLFSLIGLLPWGPLLLHRMGNWRLDQSMKEENKWPLFLALWALAPLLVFLPSNNVLVTYVLPGIPGGLLLIAHHLAQQEKEIVRWVHRAYAGVFAIIGLTGGAIALFRGNHDLALCLIWGAIMTLMVIWASIGNRVMRHAVTLVLACVVTALFALYELSKDWSDSISARDLVYTLDESDKTLPLSFLKKLPFSALFYLQADVSSRAHTPQVVHEGSTPEGDLIVRRKDIATLPKQQLELLEGGTQYWAIIDTDKDSVVAKSSESPEL